MRAVSVQRDVRFRSRANCDLAPVKNLGGSREHTDNLELMALMADWLNALVKAPWPEVDSGGDRNPYGSLW